MTGQTGGEPGTATEVSAPPPDTSREAVGRVRRVVARWWVFTSRPMSLRVAWRLSGVVDARRIPGGSPFLAWVWWWSNRLDRVVLFGLVLVAPTVMTGPLLWCAARPSRRWGLYVVVAALLVLLRKAGG